MRFLARALLVLALVAPQPAPADEALPDGETLARRINERHRADHARRRLRLVLEGGRREREREILAFWKLEPDTRHLVMFALSPPQWRGAAFLAIDRFDPAVPDDQWLYRTGRRDTGVGPHRAARLPAARRSERFLGSDFTLEDLKQEDRVEVGEHRWQTLGRGEWEGRPVLRLEQVPASDALTRALGFARALIQVDAERYVRLHTVYFDAEGRETRVVRVSDVQQVDGFWTVRRIEARQVDPPHTSVIVVDEVDYTTPPPDGIFSVRALETERGLALMRRR